MKSASAKAKGRRLQQWVAQRIGAILDRSVGRDDPVASREMGQSGTDIRLVGEVQEEFPWSVECKWREHWDVPGAILQAVANRIPGTDWVVFLKRNRRDPVVVLDARVFLDLLCVLREETGCAGRPKILRGGDDGADG